MIQIWCPSNKQNYLRSTNPNESTNTQDAYNYIHPTYSIYLESSITRVSRISRMKIFIFLLHTCPSNGKHSKLKRVNRAKHKKEKKEYNFIASRRKREEYLRRFHISRKKREEKKKKKKREMLSSRNKEFVQIGLFHPPSAIVSILANLCEPLKAFHKAILFFDPQSRITRDLQEKTRWWNQGYIYNGNTYLYVERKGFSRSSRWNNFTKDHRQGGEGKIVWNHGKAKRRRVQWRR